MHESIIVADRFLTLARQRDDTLTPMQLLKLVYIAHGWMLGLYGRPLVRDRIEAWQYGPVIPRLYNEVRRFRSQPVEGPLHAGPDALDAQETSIIHQVYDIYGHLSGPALSRLTHAKNTPWQLTWKPKEFGLEISNDIIEEHYRQKAAARGNGAC